MISIFPRPQRTKKDLRHTSTISKRNFRMEVDMGLKSLEDLRFFERVSPSKRQKNLENATQSHFNIRRGLAWCFNHMGDALQELEVLTGHKTGYEYRKFGRKVLQSVILRVSTFRNSNSDSTTN